MASEVQEVQGDRAERQSVLLKTDSFEQFLHELAVLAAHTVRDGISGGLVSRHDGRPAPVIAGSDPLAPEPLVTDGEQAGVLVLYPGRSSTRHSA